MNLEKLLYKYSVSYYKLPRSAKTLIGMIYGKIPLSIRFGKNYTLHKKILRDFENGSEQYKLDFQYIKTLETLQFAYDHIPYYQNLFDEYDFKVENFKDFSDIKKLPFLTKKIIQTELQNLYTDKIDNFFIAHTGGSSSTPMKLYTSLSMARSKERAYTNNIFSKIGYKYRDKSVTMSARGYANEKKKLYWEYQHIDNYLLVSVNHLSKEYVPLIYNEILKFKPKIFYGFPSAISLFVKICQKLGITTIENIKGVILSSESVSHEQIDLIKEFFNAPILSHYGHSERLINGYRIDKNLYYFNNSYGLAEVLNKELIGTSFDNFVMPMINYKTEDYINGQVDVFTKTNIIRSTENIQGRIQEFVVTKDKKVIPLLTIGAGHLDSYTYVDKTQFYQDTPGKIIVRIKTDYPELVEIERMVQQMHKQVNKSIDFKIEFVDHIENTHRRKRILCIQKLDIEYYLQKEKLHQNNIEMKPFYKRDTTPNFV